MSCFFIATSYGNKSVSNYFFLLAEELSARNHQVVIIVDGQRFDVIDKTSNPAVVTWPSKRPTKRQDAKFLRSLIREYKPDCMIANFGSVNMSTLVGWWHKVPQRVVWYHTLTKQIELDDKNPKWKRFFLRFRKRIVYQLTTHIIANSRATFADAQEIYGIHAEKCTVLPFLIPDPAITKTESKPCQIICVGRLYRSKGQETLIRATSFLKEQFSSLQVEFIGDGPKRQAYLELTEKLGVKEHCHFVGALPLNEVMKKMASAMVCVAPSYSEALGLVSIEAQGVGTPVVASDVDGIRDVVIDNVTGFLVPPGDSKALAEKLALLLKDEKMRQRFQQASRHHFERNFSSRNMPKHARFFEELCDS